PHTCAAEGRCEKPWRCRWESGLAIRQHPSITTPQTIFVYIHRQASVLTPSMFIAQLPQMPSRQLRRKVRVGSISFLIRISASSIIGPVLFRSNW
ncbi:hypothetical protein T310_9896, partial [Rasamsonia emersonii CBS 393.64]